MKRIALLVGVLLCFRFLFSTDVLADNEYYIEQGDFSITIPDGYYVLHRDMAEDDPALDFLGITAEEAEASLSSSGIYLEVFNDDFSTDIQISVIGVADPDEGVTITLEDNDNDLIAEVKKDISNGDYDIVEGEQSILYSDEPVNIVTGKQVKFIQMFAALYANSEKTHQAVENYTIVDSQTIAINSYCVGDEPSQEEIDLINTITKSIYFENLPSAKNAAASVNDETNSSTGMNAPISDSINNRAFIISLLICVSWLIAVVYAILCMKGKIVLPSKKITGISAQYHYGIENSSKWLNFYRKYLLIIMIVLNVIFIAIYIVFQDDFWILFDCVYLIFIILLYRELKKLSYLGYHLNFIFLWLYTITLAINHSLDENLFINYWSLLLALVVYGVFLVFNLVYFERRKVLFSDEPKCMEAANLPTEDAADTSSEAVEKDKEAAETPCNIDQMRKYKQLLDEGIITQEEFEAKKNEILKL